ncbi:hypothetical protein MNEG_11237 [Monoraphidium neglectum]|uniref:Uncharacterized protein n=1 Tax=Monoraphidium neglectum TaxID=145388 RepID=A0A0D2MQ06_9CHLO|nr:hypothetical protein MNEG_11237 [Monoraphidium neglectum]KIY96725.1 hypothetical protein MNEG_11237 [Monoraphidium neglectum]|eukprot:XP_013895745.1 hypothetical protein MNEG_11237 [Monoraphidium neglectum]
MRISNKLRAELGGASHKVKKPWTRKKYNSQRRKWEPYDPDLATDDALEKLALFWTWVRGNFPGWHHWKKAAQLAPPTLCQVHAMLAEKYSDDHILANKKAPVALLTNDPENAAAKKLAESEALPNKGERPDDRDPQ